MARSPTAHGMRSPLTRRAFRQAERQVAVSNRSHRPSPAVSQASRAVRRCGLRCQTACSARVIRIGSTIRPKYNPAATFGYGVVSGP